MNPGDSASAVSRRVQIYLWMIPLCSWLSLFAIFYPHADAHFQPVNPTVSQAAEQPLQARDWIDGFLPPKRAMSDSHSALRLPLDAMTPDRRPAAHNAAQLSLSSTHEE